MKKAVFALVVLVCIGLIGPKLVGGIVEEKYQDITNLLNENPSIVITEHNSLAIGFRVKRLAQ